MKIKLLISMLTLFKFVLAAESSSISATKQLNIDATMANNNIKLTATSKYNSDIIITKISEFTNNGDACAISENDYVIHPNSPQVMFPFTYSDLSKCFANVHVFKRYGNGAYPKVVGFYDAAKVYQLEDYITDWGAYVVVPVVFKITFTSQNITNVNGVVKYMVYKISE